MDVGWVHPWVGLGWVRQEVNFTKNYILSFTFTFTFTFYTHDLLNSVISNGLK